MNISGIKDIVYKPKTIGIQSLFILICLIQHGIFHTEMNTAITYDELLFICVDAGFVVLSKMSNIAIDKLTIAKSKFFQTLSLIFNNKNVQFCI